MMMLPCHVHFFWHQVMLMMVKWIIPAPLSETSIFERGFSTESAVVCRVSTTLNIYCSKCIQSGFSPRPSTATIFHPTSIRLQDKLCHKLLWDPDTCCPASCKGLTSILVSAKKCKCYLQARIGTCCLLCDKLAQIWLLLMVSIHLS